MKVIISHDVDHITAWEHKKDLIIPKSIIRTFIELGLGSISISELIGRFKGIIKNKWHNLDELMTFDRENNVPSTFFIGVSNGMGLNYSLNDAGHWIRKILNYGFDVGVHGISYNNVDDIKREYDLFRSLSGLNSFGIRMHYLRKDKRTLSLLDRSHYLFDSSVCKMINPFKIQDMWEFPLHLMDGHILNKNSRWQNQTLEQSIDLTKRVIDEGISRDIKYFTILSHDDSFSDSFKTSKAWYIWLISYFKDKKFKLTSFKEAIKELEATNH